MKKLWLGVVFCLFMVNNAYADRHGDFLRIECNRDLGLLEITENEIYGAKIGDYFEQGKPIYKYNIDADGEDKSHAEIILINNFAWERDNPFNYTCQLSDTLQYDVNIDWINSPRCSYTPDRSYQLNITERRTNEESVSVERELVKKVTIGCGGILEFYLTELEGNDGVYLMFDGDINRVLFTSEKMKEAVTDETIDKERERLKKISKKVAEGE